MTQPALPESIPARMEHYDYVYVTSYNECDIPLITGLGAAFAKVGKQFAVVGYCSSYVEQMHLAAGVTFFNLRQPGPLAPLAESQWPDLERRLGDTIANFVFPEQRYYMTRTAKLAARARAILDGLEQLLQRVSIGAMVHKLGAELIRRVTMVCAEQRGIHTILLGTFPAQFTGRTFVHSQFWSERDDPSIPPPNGHDEVDFDAFSALLRDVRDRRQVIHYPISGGRRAGEFLAMARELVRRQETEFLSDILSRRREMVRFRFRNMAASLLSRRTLPPGPFYFFPLHVFDDSQITVRNPEFYDQTWAIEAIARSLPAGMVLAVKMHPGLDGAVPLAFLRRMRKLENVWLLDASVNAHDVVRRSAGVIIINSTVGLEAIIHEKPVLTLGRWTFGKLGMTRDLTDFRTLSQALLKLREERPDMASVERRLYDLYGEMHRFSYNREPIDYDAMAHELIRYNAKVGT